MRKKATAVVVALIALTTFLAGQNATSSSSSGGRKAMARMAPSYPELARRMHIQGTVKIEAIVRHNGTIKSTRVLGGSPVLVESATDAVSKWKFEAGPDETTKVVEVRFAPQ